MFVYGDVVYGSNLAGIHTEKLYRGTFICQVRPMLLNRMALVSFRLFCKNLGNLQEFFGQMVYRPHPLAENCPYAYRVDSLDIPSFELLLLGEADD